MIRIKMPFYFRLQHATILMNGTIFWTSASKTIWQKIKRWWGNDDSQMCNTSHGYTLPSHGQYVKVVGKYVVVSTRASDTYYNLFSGSFCKVKASTLPNLLEIIKLCPSKYLQGLAWNDTLNKYTHAVFGKPDKNSIEVYNLATKKFEYELFYSDFSEKDWRYWESEGISYAPNGNLVIGISVKCKFWNIKNYTHVIK